MRLIKIGLANIDTIVGGFKTNTDKIIDFAQKMAKDKCTVCCFQEQSISGYPVEDLVLWDGFVDAQWRELKRFAQVTALFTACNPIFVLGITVKESGSLYNSAVVVSGGNIIGIVPKEKLPSYGVFYEQRTFSAGSPGYVSKVNGVPFGDLIFDFSFGKMAIEVCEDIWSPSGPISRRAYSGAELVVNISASHWRAGITDTRREMISTRASDNLVTVAYVNQVGGNDSLVFDGGGFVNQCGRMLGEAPRWQEGFTAFVVDLARTDKQRKENTTWRTDQSAFLKDGKQPTLIHVQKSFYKVEEAPYFIPESKNFFIPDDSKGPSQKEEYFEDLIEAMIMGLGGYFEKTKAFKHLGIALSGGKDSLLTLVIAYLYAKRRFVGLDDVEAGKAIKSFIYCFSMPSKFNSSQTKGIAKNICNELGASFKEISIQDAFLRERDATLAMLNDGEELTTLTLQNIQARVRGARMWNWANTTGGMWLQTGNMSEKAVGYTTIGGDMMGAYSLIGNLPKTVVIELLEYLGNKYNLSAVKEVLATKSSAELTENQEDEKDLMPFPVLDACIPLFIGEKMMPHEVYQVLKSIWSKDELRAMRPDYVDGMLKDWVRDFVKRFRASIFKWVQASESVHLGNLDLDRERALQLPVVQSDEWLMLSELEKME